MPRRRLVRPALFALLLLAPAASQAETFALSSSSAMRRSEAPAPLQSAQLRFGIYALGGRAFDLEVTAEPQGDGLLVQAGLRSTGTANLLLRFRMDSQLQLRFDAAGRLSPLRYASLSDGSFSRRSILMIWGPDGLPSITLEPPPEQDDREPVLPEQTRNTLDPTTALLSRALSRQDSPCAGSERIFDGRRRYNLHFEAAGMETLPPSDRSAYAGPALKCLLRFEPIAGYSRKHMENTRKLENETTEMWLARPVSQGGGASGNAAAWLPVRLRTQWMLGEVAGHVKAARIDGRMILNPLADQPPPPPPEIAP